MDEAFDPDYQTKGMYWRGGVWLPTAYMATKALERYGYGTLADETAARLLHHIARTYEDYEPHTIWECYQPEAPLPATGKDNVYRVRPDFCGWSALGPISLLIENVLGFHTIDAPRREVRWRKHQPGRHGIRGLRFGEVATDIVALDESTIEVHANAPYTLIINNRPYAVRPGYQTLRLDPIRA
jgi:glycogen debranching enzyme